ncbi:MAG: winged helix-turn-helix transcriptional regulator [Spirochaetes bacterium]|nr:winged helix-turn-helix transcriptional regulator [Spirochaetota bacterium]
MTDHLLQMKADVYKAMGEPYRLSIMQLLHERGELCVCEIISELEAEQSNISKHLSVLKQVNIVTVRKEGTKVFYKLSCPCLIDSDKCLERTLLKQAEKKLTALTK